MNANRDAEITHWLKTATRGLPRKVARDVREELAAHYADAVKEYRACGFSLVEAHRAALADLGAADQTGGALRETHTAARRYILAAAASLTFHAFVVLAATLISMRLIARVEGLIATDLIFLLPTLYALASLGVLLRQTCFFTGADRPLELARAGLVITFVPLAVSVPLTFAPEGMFPPAPLLGLALQALMLVGGGMLGVGLILLGDGLLRLDDPLWGMRPLVCLMAFVCGFAVLAVVAALLLNVSKDMASLAVGLVMIAYPIFSALLALLFFRAAVRSRRRPVRTA